MTLALLLLLLALPAVQEPAVPGPAAGEPDGRYRTLRAGGIAVHHAPRDSARAADVLRFLRDQPPLPGIPAGFPREAEVYLAPDEAAFDSLTGGQVPEWGAGVMVPDRERIVMPSFAERRARNPWSEARTLRHEWAHLGLHQYLEGHTIPRWFTEGYAEWASGGWDTGEGWRLRVGLATGGTPSLDSLTLGWPRRQVPAELAYMLSGTALEYMVRGSGERGLGIFLDRWRREGGFETALRSVYGVTMSQFEENWREYVKDRYGWLFVLSHSAVFWLFASLLLLVLAWVRRRRDREAMARLRATESDDTPAWWEEPDGPRPG